MSTRMPDDNRPTVAVATPPQPAAAAALAVLPGLALTAAIAAAAFALHDLPGLAGFSPMILAILIGITFHNLVGTPALETPGVNFSLRRILRLAIILLGLQLTAQQVAGSVLVTSPALAPARRRLLTAPEVRKMCWVYRERGSGTRAIFEASLAKLDIAVSALDIVLELPSNEAVRTAVEHGAGTAALSRLAVL
jgi:hypothetical protein